MYNFPIYREDSKANRGSQQRPVSPTALVISPYTTNLTAKSPDSASQKTNISIPRENKCVSGDPTIRAGSLLERAVCGADWGSFFL